MKRQAGNEIQQENSTNTEKTALNMRHSVILRSFSPKHEYMLYKKK